MKPQPWALFFSADQWKRWLIELLGLPPHYVRNELHLPVSAATAWGWLVWAPRWNEWYPAAPAVSYPHQAAPELRTGTEFTWQREGATFRATVDEYVPMQWLSWRVQGPGLRAYHTWQLADTPTGCHILSEETQTGWRASLHEWLEPHGLFSYNQSWLRHLRQQALTARPPYIRQAQLLTKSN